jgi:flavoprotein
VTVEASTLAVVVAEDVVDELFDEPHEASNIALITNKLSTNQITFLFIAASTLICLKKISHVIDDTLS